MGAFARCRVNLFVAALLAFSCWMLTVEFSPRTYNSAPSYPPLTPVRFKGVALLQTNHGCPTTMGKSFCVPTAVITDWPRRFPSTAAEERSEERRVGKECRCRGEGEQYR